MPSKLSSPETVIIIGAGVCGLGIGWRLAQAGCEVTLYDQGKAGRGATWAAAGMLAAAVETEPGESALTNLNRHSQSLWPTFAREVEEASGLPCGYRDEGTLVVALTRDDAAKLRFDFDFQISQGLNLTWLTGAEARRMEPSLNPRVTGAIFSPDDHQADNRLLADALISAVTKAGGKISENTPVEEIIIEDDKAVGVRIDGNIHKADCVLLAAGAWSRGIAGLPEAVRPPVRPIKGQMMALSMDPADPLLRHVLWAPGIYMAPREDGRLIIGATVEEKGFDDSLTAGGVYAILDAAWRALPGIEELAIAEMWTGFRPGSRDDAPILGMSGVEGLIYATGHHRNGILLAPVTANAVSELILTGETDPAIAAFGIDRFDSAGKHATTASRLIPA